VPAGHAGGLQRPRRQLQRRHRRGLRLLRRQHQITAAWQTASDIDLHVVDPTGAEVFYGARNSASGGELDHDANAACRIAPPTVENVYWNSPQPPSGNYQIRLVAYDMCGVPNTPTTVSISVGGRVIGTYSVSFTQQNQSYTIPFTVP